MFVILKGLGGAKWEGSLKPPYLGKLREEATKVKKEGEFLWGS